MKSNKSKMRCNGGFTLIELLVVVLIIGILAAVAVPQYKKAVFKSRFTQVQTIFNTYMKAIDVYVLANGFPQDTVDLYGLLDTSFEGKRYETLAATYLPFGHFAAYYSDNVCFVAFKDTLIAGPTRPLTNPSPWLHGIISLAKHADTGTWFLRDDTDISDTTNLKIICQWWASSYGVEQMEDEIKAKCAAVGIN